MNNRKLLSIAIPTYNRAEILVDNLSSLVDIFLENALEDLIEIVVLNNASLDDTIELVNTFISENPRVDIHLYSQKENVGVINSAIDLLSLSKYQYIMYLGDDDYICANYLKSVITLIQSNANITCIIPSYQNITTSGEYVGIGRDINKKSQSFNEGFFSTYQNSWRGHQMSGIVYLRELILSEHNKYKIDNLYLWLFFVEVCSNNGTLHHITEYPVLVTRPGQANKVWGYGDDGLIEHAFENYKAYTAFNYVQRVLLQFKFLDEQYWRYAMYLKLGIGKFVKAIFKVVLGKNTLLVIRILFPFAIPIIAIKKVIVFSVSGQLFQIINTKVDI